MDQNDKMCKKTKNIKKTSKEMKNTAKIGCKNKVGRKKSKN